MSIVERWPLQEGLHCIVCTCGQSGVVLLTKDKYQGMTQHEGAGGPPPLDDMQTSKQIYKLCKKKNIIWGLLLSLMVHTL